MTTRFRATVFCAALAALPARADVTLQLFADVAADLRHDASRTHADFSSNHLDFFGKLFGHPHCCHLPRHAIMISRDYNLQPSGPSPRS